MSSLTNANTLSSAFIDLATYGELESYMYGNPNKLSIEKFQTKSINLLKSNKLKNAVFLLTAIGFIINYAHKYNLTYFEPCDLLQKMFLISAILSIIFIVISTK